MLLSCCIAMAAQSALFCSKLGVGLAYFSFYTRIPLFISSCSIHSVAFASLALSMHRVAAFVLSDPSSFCNLHNLLASHRSSPLLYNNCDRYHVLILQTPAISSTHHCASRRMSYMYAQAFWSKGPDDEISEVAVHETMCASQFIEPQFSYYDMSHLSHSFQCVALDLSKVFCFDIPSLPCIDVLCTMIFVTDPLSTSLGLTSA